MAVSRPALKQTWFSAGLIICLIMFFNSLYVSAADLTLAWDPPTTNEDGTYLDDLSGYKLHYGISSGDYTETVDIGNATTYQITDLSDGLTYYFSVTAYTFSGVESTYSDEISFTVPSGGGFAPDISVSDSVAPAIDLQISYGGITQGSYSDQTVTVTNDGNADLLMGTIAQNNPVSPPFSIRNDSCSGQIISSSTSCTFTLRFSPAATGPFSDSFDIPSDDPDEGSVTVTLSGSGQTRPVPDVTVGDSVAPTDDQKVQFGSITQGNYSDQTVTVTNDGNADLLIGTIAQSNRVSAPFSIRNDLCSGQSISSSSSCTFTLRFSPAATGSFNDSFDIPSNDPDEGSVTVSATGYGQAMPKPDITVGDSVAPTDDQKVPFGDITQGSYADQTVTLTNDGNADLLIGAIARNNPVSAPFSIRNDLCSGQRISSSSRCTFTIRFSPVAAGPFNDSLNIPSDDPDEGAITVSINGSGTPPPVPDITITDSIGSANDLQMPFGDITEGLSSVHTVTVTNSGNAGLLIGSVAQNVPVSEPFSILNDTCSGQTVAPSSHCSLSVSFSPSTAAVFNDSFDIPSNDPDESSLTVNVSGTGLLSDSNNPPSEPELVSPANKSKGVGNGKKVGFRWKKSKDPDGNTVTYDLNICQDPDMTTGCVTETNIASLQSTQAVYYAGIGTLSTGLLFFGLACLVLTNPKGRKIISMFVVMLSITGILFLVSCGRNDTAIDANTLPSGNIPLDEVSREIAVLDNSTTYYWQVVARDAEGGEAYSPVWQFETQ